jgi:hypothetical protein
MGALLVEADSFPQNSGFGETALSRWVGLEGHNRIQPRNFGMGLKGQGPEGGTAFFVGLGQCGTGFLGQPVHLQAGFGVPGFQVVVADLGP